MKVFSNLKDIKTKWKNQGNLFLDIKFLDCFYQNHKNIKHIFILNKDFILYSHIFKLRLNQATNYLNNNFIFKTLFSLIKINILYLTNSFITNIPSYYTTEKIHLNNLIESIKEKNRFFLIVIPDFLFKNLKGSIKKDFTKVEVEEDMLDTKPKECTLDNILDNLSTANECDACAI